MGSDLRVSLERGHHTIATRDLRGCPMFLQPQTRDTRSLLSPAGWTSVAFGSPLLHSIGQRVAVFFPDDNLWFPTSVVLTSDLLVVLQFDDSHWPDLDIFSPDSPLLLAMSSLPGSMGPPALRGSGSVTPAPVDHSPRLPADDADMVSLQSTSAPPRPEPPVDPAPILTAQSLDGLYLSSSESGYQGVYRDERNGSCSSWFARIWRNGGWHRLGTFESARSAALAYKQARDTPYATAPGDRAGHASTAPSHCVYPNPRPSRAGLWIARTYAQGSYHVLGSVFTSRRDATDAYVRAMASVTAPARRSPDSQLVTSHRGVQLQLAPESVTGYQNVRPHGTRFRAIAQLRVSRVKKVRLLGTFSTAIEAAYCVALHGSELNWVLQAMPIVVLVCPASRWSGGAVTPRPCAGALVISVLW
jgi:hypothetical protein